MAASLRNKKWTAGTTLLFLWATGLYLLFLVTTISVHAQNVDFKWVTGGRGAGNNVGYGVETDDSGNVYVTGQFTGTIYFNPAKTSDSLTVVGAQADMFVAKYAPDSSFLWARRGGGNGLEQGFSIAVDVAGNVYVTGTLGSPTADFNPWGTNTPGGTGGTLSRYGLTDMMLVKYDRNGNFRWVKRGGGTSGDEGRGIAVDNIGNVYVIGHFGSATAEFDPGTGGTITRAGSGFVDVFVVKYDSSGNFRWAKGLGGAADDYGRDIAVDGAGNVYVTGRFIDNANFNPGGAGGTLTSAGAGSSDGFLAKYTPDGSYIWAKRMGGSSPDGGFGVSVDATDNVYVTGYFSSADADFNPGGSGGTLTYSGSVDAFIAKYDSAGNYVWGKGMGGTGGDYAYRSTLDARGNVYITGYFSSAMADFNPGGSGGSGGMLTLTGSSGSDVFIAKYNQDGNYLWAGSVGGNAADQGEGISVDGSGNVYVTGSFQGTADFNPGSGSTTRTATGANGVFVLKLSQQVCEVLTPFTEDACDSFTFNGVTYTSSGVYADTFITNADCDSIVTLDLTINSSPAASVTISDITLTAGSAESYQWFDCDKDSIIDGATGESYTAVQTGNYAVIITTGGCSDTSECTLVEVGVGINELGAGNKVQLYPNPATGLVTIQTEQALKHATIRLMNIVGQLMREQTGVSGGLFTLDMMQYTAGIYFIEISEAGKSVRLKIVKE